MHRWKDARTEGHKEGRTHIKRGPSRKQSAPLVFHRAGHNDRIQTTQMFAERNILQHLQLLFVRDISRLVFGSESVTTSAGGERTQPLLIHYIEISGILVAMATKTHKSEKGDLSRDLLLCTCEEPILQALGEMFSASCNSTIPQLTNWPTHLPFDPQLAEPGMFCVYNC